MIQTWGFCYILWFKKLDYNPTQHLYTWAIQNRVLTLRCWKSSTNFEIFKIQLAKETTVVFEWKTGTQSFPRLDGGTYGIGYGLTGLAMDLRTRGGRLTWKSSPSYFRRDSRASETRARVKITPREKRQHAAKFFFSPRGVIFTRARVSLALLSLRKNGGLLARSLSRRSLGSTLSLRTLRDIYVGCLLFHRRITSHFFPLSPSRYCPRGKGKTGRWRMYSSKRVSGTPY